MTLSKLPFPLVALLATSACGSKADADGEPGQETGPCVEYECLGELVCLSDLCVDPNATPATGDGGDDGSPTADDTGQAPAVSSVSLLVVLDNSGSMGEEQARLPAGLAALTDALTDAGVDWRLGVTTTDDGNPWCDGTGPEAGQLVFSSCRSRTQDFVFAGATTLDYTTEACLANCPAEWSNFQTTPTMIDGSAEPAARPWIERIGGTTNLPAELSVSQALACVVPQGISGCGFEHQLESMRKAITRAGTVAEANEGFVPDDALLVVLMVSDEADCSHNPAADTIFLPEGNRVFWSNPEDGAPTSAVCWNAGVDCSAGACNSADKDVDGNPVAADAAAEDAALRPVARYLDTLGSRGNTMFALIGGVDAAGNATYASGVDPQFQADFGIGPGCESPDGRAVPPVRMREVAEAFSGGTQNMFSICDDDYGPAMSAVSAAILAQFP